ncbi:MAG: hypothetical protein V1875_10035 [Candidatus Altiarchaeota archaeon]
MAIEVTGERRGQADPLDRIREDLTRMQISAWTDRQTLTDGKKFLTSAWAAVKGGMPLVEVNPVQNADGGRTAAVANPVLDGVKVTYGRDGKIKDLAYSVPDGFYDEKSHIPATFTRIGMDAAGNVSNEILDNDVPKALASAPWQRFPMNVPDTEGRMLLKRPARIVREPKVVESLASKAREVIGQAEAGGQAVQKMFIHSMIRGVANGDSRLGFIEGRIYRGDNDFQPASDDEIRTFAGMNPETRRIRLEGLTVANVNEALSYHSTKTLDITGRVPVYQEGRDLLLAALKE